MKGQIEIGYLTSLILGGMIYILFRSNSLLMFDWFEQFGILDFIVKSRNLINPKTHLVPRWILYSAPDGLWLFSYICFMFVIWKNSVTTKNIIWIILLPIYAFYTEFGQFFGFISGTFDLLDLIAYGLGLILPFIIFKNKINFNFNFKFNNYEKLS